MTEPFPDMDMKIGAMLKALADTISEELPDVGFVIIMGRSAEENSPGSLLSVSNVDDDNTIGILETILVRRKQMTAVPSTPTVQ